MQNITFYTAPVPYSSINKVNTHPNKCYIKGFTSYLFITGYR